MARNTKTARRSTIARTQVAADSLATLLTQVDFSRVATARAAIKWNEVGAPRLKSGGVLGSFGKSLGGVSVNFNASGGAECDSDCRLHPQSTNDSPAGVRCYAVRTEERPDRSQLTAKLARHGAMPFGIVCGRAAVELRAMCERGKAPTWLRLCTAGALPQNPTEFDLSQLRALCAVAHEFGIPIHAPTEAARKVAIYAPAVAPYAVVRESAQSFARFVAARGAVSFVAGAEESTLPARLAAAREAARVRREASGRKCIVCPAVANTFATKLQRARVRAEKRRAGDASPAVATIENARAKCGACIACALPMVDIVYPAH